MRRVMNHAKRINQIVSFHRHKAAQLLGISQVKSDGIFDAVNAGPLPRDFHRLLRQVHGGDVRSMARKVHGVGPDPATYFQHFLPAPLRKFREARNVALNEIFPRLYLVEILPASHRLRRMPYVARTPIPVLRHSLNFDLFKSHRFQRHTPSWYSDATPRNSTNPIYISSRDLRMFTARNPIASRKGRVTSSIAKHTGINFGRR